MNESPSAGDSRRIRSFVRRSGRITAAQRNALLRLWPKFGLDLQGRLDLDRTFHRVAPRHLEIGFGMGDALLAMSEAYPEHDYLGLEVHEAGIGRVMHQLELRGTTNVRVVRGDAVEVLERMLPDASLAVVHLLFPDPWPKKRHHKRRLVNPAFAAQISTKLGIGGRFCLATDWEPYAEVMLSVLEAEPRLRNLAGPGGYMQRPVARPETKFERRAGGLGHAVRDLVFERR